jgi:hypothetical protein
MQVEKYHNEKGEVAVLYSPGFGAGWSTWWADHVDFAVFDKGLVEIVLNAKDADEKAAKIEEYINSQPFAEDVYLGGVYQLAVMWLEQGQQFEINEYDGHESVHVIGNRVYHQA